MFNVNFMYLENPTSFQKEIHYLYYVIFLISTVFHPYLYNLYSKDIVGTKIETSPLL